MDDMVMTNGTETDGMTDNERLDEVAQVFAVGMLRLKAKDVRHPKKRRVSQKITYLENVNLLTINHQKTKAGYTSGETNNYSGSKQTERAWEESFRITMIYAKELKGLEKV